MARRHYVSSHEIKVRDQRPRHRQKVLFRISGNKSYILGEYDRILGAFDTPSGSQIREQYIKGWLPIRTPRVREVKR